MICAAFGPWSAHGLRYLFNFSVADVWQDSSAGGLLDVQVSACTWMRKSCMALESLHICSK